MLTAEQIEMRKTGIGASEIGAIAGLSPYATAIDIWAAKVGVSDPTPETPAMRVGNAVEPAIAELYSLETGRKLKTSETVRHRIFPWALATPDRVVDGEDRLLEIKTVGARMARDWGTDSADAIPEAVRAQVEWQMFVLGIHRCDVAALIGGTDFRIYEIERDQELAMMLLDIGRRFWEGHVLTREPPTIDGSDAARRAIEARFPRNSGQFVALTPDADVWARKAARARKRLDEATIAKDEAENHLRALIGDADGVCGPDWKITWKASKDSTVIDWEAVARELGAPVDLISKHTTTRPGSRRFLASGPLFKGEGS